MFDIADDARARALSSRAPVNGVSCKTTTDRGWAKPVAANESPTAAPPIGRKHRILVVEDSVLLADSIRDSLQERGYSVVGPTRSVQAACVFARTAELDGAVLDLKLGHELCFPIASVLKARGIPFVILTGYPVKPNVPGFEPAAWLAKPMEPEALREAIDRMLAQQAAGAGGKPLPLHKAIEPGRQAVFRPASEISVDSAASAGGVTVSECITEPSSSNIAVPIGAFGDKVAPVRVLLVEGDPRTRAALAALLAKRGFDVQSFDEHPALHGAPSDARRSAAPAEKIVCGKLAIDLPQRRAWWGGVEVPLTAGEFAIVVLLASRAGCCVDNRTVYDCLHYKGFQSGHGEKGFWVNVRSVIRRIRQKFRSVDGSFDELETQRAFGYRWRKPA